MPTKVPAANAAGSAARRGGNTHDPARQNPRNGDRQRHRHQCRTGLAPGARGRGRYDPAPVSTPLQTRPRPRGASRKDLGHLARLFVGRLLEPCEMDRSWPQAAGPETRRRGADPVRRPQGMALF